MKYSLCLLALLFLSLKTLNAQERYREQISDSILVDTYTYAEKDSQQLALDLYQPAFDPEFERPMVIYIHGGGFSGGQRDEAYIRRFCKQFASYGYVVASMSYRLTRAGQETGFGCDCPAQDKMNTFYAAVEDVQDATYFLIERRDQFGINPQQIILAGSSAGAETALNAAFQPPYCYGLDSGPVSYAGVISMAGAIPDTSLIYNESAVPGLLFHGTCDKLVPYATAPHHYCDETRPGYLLLNGSYSIAEKLRQLGKPYWLHTICGAGHEVYHEPMEQFFDEMIAFCADFVLGKKNVQMHTITEGAQKCAASDYNFCANDKEEDHEE